MRPKRYEKGPYRAPARKPWGPVPSGWECWKRRVNAAAIKRHDGRWDVFVRHAMQLGGNLLCKTNNWCSRGFATLYGARMAAERVMRMYEPKRGAK